MREEYDSINNISKNEYSDINTLLDEILWVLSDTKRIKVRAEKIDKLLKDE